jgi:hypothetical protein
MSMTDENEGQGGSYRLDKKSGKRVLVERTAPAAPAGPAQAFPGKPPAHPEPPAPPSDH